MQSQARMVCSSLFDMVWPCLVKFKWRWWRQVINFICIYLHSLALVLALNLGVSNMITWHDHQSNYKNLNNVKVKHRLRGRNSVGEFDTRKVQQQLETSHIAYDNMLGADLKEEDLRWHETKLGKIIWSTLQDALKLKCCKQKGQIDFGSGGHTLSTWVAQNIMRTSPLQSLQKTTPKPYIIW